MTGTRLSRSQELQLLSLLALMIFLAPFATNAYLPVMPQMGRDLGASAAQTQLTVAFFLGGAAVGPLIAGPLSDAVGRRGVINGGIALFALGSAFCALSPTIEILIAMRFVQALGGTAAVIAGRALLADIYTGDRLAQRMSALMMVVAVGPIIAPVLGGWAGVAFGWASIFWGLFAAAALITLVGQLFLQETHPPDARSPFELRKSMSGYLPLIRHRVILPYVLTGLAMMAVQIGFVSAAPFLFADLFAMTPSDFARYFALCAIFAVLANFVNIRCVGRWGFRTVLLWEAGLVGLNGLVLLLGLAGGVGLWALWAGSLAIVPLSHLLITNATTGALECDRDRLGAVSALFGTFRFGGGMLGSLVLAWVGGGAAQAPYVLSLFAFSAFAGGAAVLAVQRDRAIGRADDRAA